MTEREQHVDEAEKHLARRVFEVNQTATHERPLRGNYSYNQILGADLVELCVELASSKAGTLRLLDIGCGSGLALHQLEEALEQRGLRERFELFGMGLNWYKRMYISPRRFLLTGLYHSRHRGPHFDIVVSVFAFHYLWHKLEGLEKIHNELLADEGQALLHFPGFLAWVPDRAQDSAESEVARNEDFSSHLEQLHGRGGPRMEYSQVPFWSGDDDACILNEFGRLRFSRAPGSRLDFGLALEEIGVVPAAFSYKYSDVSRPEYVASRYRRSMAPSQGLAAASLDVQQLARSEARVASPLDAAPDLELVIYPLHSPLIVVLFPGAREGLSNSALPFPLIANNVQEAGLGAVIRCNNPLLDGDRIVELLHDHVRRLMDYIRANVQDICGTVKPRVAMVGYSAGASAIAAFASEYPEVEQLLLLAPSLDAGREVIEPGIAAFGGEVYIVSGDVDEIVPPEQARWFFEAATSSVKKRFVEIGHCDHAFSGEYNQALARHAPLWALGGNMEFPPADLSFG